MKEYLAMVRYRARDAWLEGTRCISYVAESVDDVYRMACLDVEQRGCKLISCRIYEFVKEVDCYVTTGLVQFGDVVEQSTILEARE